jgi:hypothetical protein
MFNGQAAEMPAEHYRTGPIIHTRGFAPRLFRASASVRYRAVVQPNGVLDNLGVWEGDSTISRWALADSRLSIINHHVRQSFDEYQADAVWELLIGVPESVR